MKFIQSFNIGPFRYVPVLYQGASVKSNFDLILQPMQWGIGQREGLASLVINARFEEVTEKYMFKGLLSDMRCAVVIDGYYEWKPNEPGSSVKSGSVPYFIKMKEGAMVLAGLYVERIDPETKELYRKVVLMTQSSSKVPTLKAVHHRMPVFLDETTLYKWLDGPQFSFTQCEKAIEKSKVTDHLEAYQVSDQVNSIKNDGPDLIISRKKYNQKSLAKGLGRFFKPKPIDKIKAEIKQELDPAREESEEEQLVSKKKIRK